MIVAILMAIGAIEAMAKPKLATPPGHNRLWGPLSHYDTNDDNTVSSEEFDAVVMKAGEAALNALLEKYDDDDDGEISEEEAQAVHDAAADQWLERLLNFFDTNDDGEISEDDGEDVCLAWLGSLTDTIPTMTGSFQPRNWKRLPKREPPMRRNASLTSMTVMTMGRSPRRKSSKWWLHRFRRGLMPF